MKNSSLLLLAVFSFCIHLLVAQQNKFDIGIVAGPNFNRLVGNKTVNDLYENATFFSAGLNLQYNFPKAFSITSGLLYEIKGAATEILITDHTGKPVKTLKIRTGLSYLVLPLMVKYAYGQKMKVFVAAGAYLSYNLNPSKQYVITSAQFHALDFGALFNPGLSAPLTKKTTITLEGRYAMGFQNIYEPAINDIKMTTRSLSILLGINYKLGSRIK